MDDADLLSSRAPNLCIPIAETIDPEWDQVLEAAGGDLFQSSRWALARRMVGIRAEHVRVTGPDGSLVGGGWIYSRRYAPGLHIGFMPRGPVFFEETEENIARCLWEVMARARRRGLFMLAVQPIRGGKLFDRVAEAMGYRFGVPSVATDATIRLRVDMPEEQLLAGLSPKRRNEVRRTLRSGFVIEESKDVDAFYRLYVLTSQRQNFIPISRQHLEAQWQALGPAHRQMFIVRYGGVPVAGTFNTSFAGISTGKLRGWDTCVDAPPRANVAIVWASLLGAAKRGHTYDFGGLHRRVGEMLARGEAPQEIHSSYAGLKLGFGGQPVLFPLARFVLTLPGTNAAFGAAAARFLATPLGHRLASRGRIG